MSKKALIVMAKRPSAGQTKTRLVPPFTYREAADLYEHMLHDALDLARAAAYVTPFVAYAPADVGTGAYFRTIAPDFERKAQLGATLGERLNEVLSYCLDAGYDQVAAMNSDSPTLPLSFLDDAFRRLDVPETDVVLGPCVDGGYYLIGWKRPHPRLVREVEMSTEHVLADTLRIAAEEKLNVSLLESWYDVDTLADLQQLRRELNGSPPAARHTRRFLRQQNAPIP